VWFTFDALFAWCDLHASRWEQWPRDPGYRPMYYDRAGFAIPGRLGATTIEWETSATARWALLHANEEYKQVARDELPDGSTLSTVWIGLDHAFAGPPLFFETMRFSSEITTKQVEAMENVPPHEFSYHESLEFPDPETGEMTEQLRYGSEEHALAVHHEIVRRFVLKDGH
jgi:hypothetical protein